MRKSIIAGLVLSASLAWAAYPYVQIDTGKVLLTDEKIQFAAAVSISATGGTVTTNGGYIKHTFTVIAATNFVITGGSLNCEYAVVGWGGKGADNPAQDSNGGGGGGGQVVTGAVELTAGSYSVSFGAFNQPASFGAVTAQVGEAASGGTGGTFYAPGGDTGFGGTDGPLCSIAGVGTYFGGGGTAGDEAGTALGGGGAGGQVGDSGGPGDPNTGGGGGGAGYDTGSVGGAGGSSIIIIWYLIP